jgi:hypothetical protein
MLLIRVSGPFSLMKLSAPLFWIRTEFSLSRISRLYNIIVSSFERGQLHEELL